MSSKIVKMGCYFWIQTLMVLYCMTVGYLMALPTTEAKLCTKKVKITHPNVKKIAMTKRIPAQCSNWDRAWTWITKMDCGTKYVIEYVEFTTHVKEHYKIEYGCCPGDEDCNEAEARKQGLEDSDDRFLAIAFGSATAALSILIIIIIISICRKKHQGLGICKSRSEYESAQDRDPSDVCDHVSPCQNEYVCDDVKAGESEYEEIRDIPQDDISNVKAYKGGVGGSEKRDYFQTNTGEKRPLDTDARALAHMSPEPSAPLLETLSETYADSGLVANRFENQKEDSKNVQCTDDIDYIAISKLDNLPSYNGNRIRDFDIKLNDLNIGTNTCPEFSESNRLSLHSPCSVSTENIGSEQSNEQRNNDNACIAEVHSYEQLDPNLAQAHSQPYEALQATEKSPSTSVCVLREVDI